MLNRDRLGWLLSGILIGMLVMVSCDVVESGPTARPSVADAAQQGAADTPGLPSDPSPAAPQTLPVNQAGADSYGNTVAAVFQKGNPSVVRINVSNDQGSSLGTGFVYDTDGHIVTNFHVIAGSISGGGSVIVEFINGEAGVGDVVGFDQDSDLAVVKMRDIDRSILVKAELGDSSELRVGDLAVAIGNPYGENRTATAGIISAVRAAKKEGDDQYFSIPGVLQTDASINPGNSGGPLFNARGQVIGVNTFILDPSGRGANIGIGYAVPINLVKRVAPVLIQGRQYVHPYLGLTDLRTLNSLAARQNKLPTKGILINGLDPNGPSAAGGLREGDTIVAINGQAVVEGGDLISFVEFNTSPGDTITVTVVDQSGQSRDVKVQLAQRQR